MLLEMHLLNRYLVDHTYCGSTSEHNYLCIITEYEQGHVVC